jgi:hypothetical protein
MMGHPVDITSLNKAFKQPVTLSGFLHLTEPRISQNLFNKNGRILSSSDLEAKIGLAVALFLIQEIAFRLTTLDLFKQLEEECPHFEIYYKLICPEPIEEMTFTQ